MTEKEFLDLCKKIVREYTIEHFDVTDGPQEFSVYCVWFCKTLQNAKAILSTSVRDGMIYEVTFNGDKQELYLDAYKKFENRRIPVNASTITDKK